MHGQIWRLVTFIIYPPTMGTFVFDSVFFGIISLFLYYSLGVTLERVWGAFRFNVFFLMGMVGEILAALVSYFVFHQNLYVTTGFLNFSLFLAFAICFPDVQFYLFMVIPVKAKWMAIAESAVYVYSFLVGSASTRCEIVLSLANVILFFLMTRNYSGSIQRRSTERSSLNSRQRSACRDSQDINVRYVAEQRRRREFRIPLLFEMCGKPGILPGSFIYA